MLIIEIVWLIYETIFQVNDVYSSLDKSSTSPFSCVSDTIKKLVSVKKLEGGIRSSFPTSSKEYYRKIEDDLVALKSQKLKHLSKIDEIIKMFKEKKNERDNALNVGIRNFVPKVKEEEASEKRRLIY
jgi:hypothetical protein